MTVNEPGIVARRQMTISHPLAAAWPGWLRTWWGQVQPPGLLLRIGPFPTLTRLPSPALFPALALDVLARVNSFLSASIPFLDTGAAETPSLATPRLDYRLRRPRLQMPQAVPVADAHADGGPNQAATPLEHAPRLEHTPVESALGSADVEHSLPPEESHPSDAGAPESISQSSLTPFQESAWEPVATEPEHVPTLREAVHHLDEWRAAWGATDAPQPTAHSIGMLQNGLDANLPSPVHALGGPVWAGTGSLVQPLVHSLAGAASQLDTQVSEFDSSSGLAHLPEAHPELGSPDASAVGATPVRVNPELRMPPTPARPVRQLSPETAQLPGLLAREFSAQPEVEVAPLLPDGTPPKAPGPLHSLSAFSVAEALFTPHLSPLVGEVIQRQERAIESLALIGHAPAAAEALRHEAIGLTGEHTRAINHLETGEESPASRAETQLPQNAQPSDMLLHNPHVAEPAAVLAHDAVQHLLADEPLATPASAEPDRAAHQSTENRSALMEDIPASRAILTSQPGLELRHPLTMLAQRMTLNSLPQFPQLAAPGEDMGIAALLPLAGPFARQELANFAPSPSESVESQAETAERAKSIVTAEAQGVFTPRSAEQAQVSATHMFTGFLPGLAPLEHEFTRGEHPLALRPLPEISHLLPLVNEVERAAQFAGQPLNLNLPHEQLTAPHMELRRDSHAPNGLAQSLHGAEGGAAAWPWSNESTAGLASDQHPAAAQAAALAAPETETGGGDAGGVWQGSSAPAAAPSPALDVDVIARQVLSMLQSQLRAERDRHQLYDR